MHTIKILLRSIVRTFYTSNIGFFLVVFYLAFGLMRSTEHIAIASSISTSWPLTLLTIFLWLLYGVKANSFVWKSLQGKSYRILRDLALYHPNMQWLSLNLVYFSILAPAWLYGLFIGYFNLQYTTYDLLFVMIGFLVLLTLMSTFFTVYIIKKPVWEKQIGLWYRWIGKRFALPYAVWYIRNLFVNDPIATFLAKLGSLVLLVATFYLYSTDTYDWRLLGIGTLFAFTFNIMLLYGWYDFMTRNSWINNVPRQKSNIVLSATITFVILFTPEIILITANSFPMMSLINIFGLSLFMVAFALFWIGLLIQFPMSKEDYGKRVFYLTLVMVVVIMFGVPVWLIDTLFILIGSWGISGLYRLKWGN